MSSPSEIEVLLRYRKELHHENSKAKEPRHLIRRHFETRARRSEENFRKFGPCLVVMLASTALISRILAHRDLNSRNQRRFPHLENHNEEGTLFVGKRQVKFRSKRPSCVPHRKPF